MERSRAVLIALACALFSRISGAEVEMRVRPGDDVTLYSDCVWKRGYNAVWFRNSSHKHLGLYFCARQETKIINDGTGVIRYEDIYHYGSRSTRLSFLEPTPPVSDCSVCWKLLEEFAESHNGGQDVCYASLDLPPRGQKRLKKRVESSDFSTYSEIGVSVLVKVEKLIQDGMGYKH
ncbi:hypothetical protein SRHO_G00248280 [Serrasalmus rhombeus]